jgi:hypothetical protein
MIMQHPDGTAEIYPLPPALARWTRDLRRRVQALRAGVEMDHRKLTASDSSPCRCAESGAC